VVEDDETMTTTHRLVSPQEWARISGVELAALLWPNPTPTETILITDFLDRHRNNAQQQHRVSDRVSA
jgi:hypothetical protein